MTTAIEDIVPETTDQAVVSRPASEPVGAAMALIERGDRDQPFRDETDRGVVAEKEIGAVAAIHPVRTAATDQQVVSTAAQDTIVTGRDIARRCPGGRDPAAGELDPTTVGEDQVTAIASLDPVTT